MANSTPAPERAQVVIVGGGIAGVSVAYHLATLGWTDVVLLERHTLTSGTTWHAAGLITQARATPGTRRIVQESLEVFRELQQSSGVGFRETGTIHLATHPDRWEELLRQATVLRAEGIEAVTLAPDEIPARFPLLNPDGLIGGVLHPRDGRGNASDTTLALAKAAKAMGVKILERTEAVSVLVRGDRVSGVETSERVIEAEHVVNCAGLWGRSLALTHGVNLPLQSLAHYYVVTDAVPGLGSGLPTLKSSDDCAYVRDEGGGLMVGFFEPGSSVWRHEEHPTDSGFVTMPGEWTHLEPYLERLMERIPTLADVGVRLFFCGPESFTPDGNYHLGPVGSVSNYWAAAGFNSVGFLSGPGAGRFLAQWIVAGEAPYALTEADPRRVHAYQANRSYVEARSLETLDLSYGIHWPFEQRESVRGLRRSPVHDQLQERGAVFGEEAGWERANWFARDGIKPRYEYSFGRQNWFDCSANEHRAVREGVGFFDLSSFGKIMIAGPDALDLLEFVCANRIDVAVGKVVYTQMLNSRGGIESDVTVARTENDKFLLLTAAASTTRDLHWLRAHGAGRSVWIHDSSNAWAMYSLMGPRAREVLQTCSSADFSNEAFPFGTTAEIDLGSVNVRATRLTYVGELGWELLVPVEMGAYVFEQLWGAGEPQGMQLCGYHALNSLRMEKAYRSWSHDIGPDVTPLEAGLGFAVDWEKPSGFLGREALAEQRQRGVSGRLLQLLMLDPAVLLHHDEPVFRDGQLVGRVASASFGHTLGGSVALAYVSAEAAVTADWLSSGTFHVEVGGVSWEASASLRPMYDPTSSRPKG